MAAGLPQVSSLGGELEALIREHRIGEQYDAGMPRSLQRAILALVDAPRAKRLQMRRRARALFQARFDARAIYPRMAGFVERVALSAGASQGRILAS